MSKTKKKSAPVSVSTLKNLNDGIASKFLGRSPKTPKRERDAITYDGLIRKSDKKEKQDHTEEDAVIAIGDLRKRIGNLYGQGKIKSLALVAILTKIDNATFFKCCGEYDRAVAQCESCNDELNNL